jgi:hypothetical protein
MRAVVFERPLALSIQDLPTPRPREHELLIRVEACGVFCTDPVLSPESVHVWAGGGFTGIGAGAHIQIEPLYPASIALDDLEVVLGSSIEPGSGSHQIRCLSLAIIKSLKEVSYKPKSKFRYDFFVLPIM